MLKAYIGIKPVLAEPMNLGDYNTHRGWQIPDDEDPSREGYLIVYSDSYQSWSPKEVFEDAYEPEEKLSFSAALYLLKQGKKITRTGWNGKGMYLTYVAAEEWASSCQEVGDSNETLYEKQPFIAMKTAQDKVVPWLASQSDILDNDWMIFQL